MRGGGIHVFHDQNDSSTSGSCVEESPHFIAMNTFQVISILRESNVIVMLLILTVVTFRARLFPQLLLRPLVPYHLESLSKGRFGAILSFSDLSDLEFFFCFILFWYKHKQLLTQRDFSST